jgi:hypothetical protein
MLWALGYSHAFGYHKSRGAFEANIFSGPEVEPDYSSFEEVDLLMPNVEVKLGPGGQDAKNPYICGIFDLQMVAPNKNMIVKHHVVQMTPKLNAASEKYVHHMILYGCDESQGFTNKNHNAIIAECESMPKGCYSMKWPWAMGSSPIIFPADVGKAFGGKFRWMALQVHYYNPSGVTGVFDSSGVALRFAPTLRSQDAEYFVLNGGTSPNQRDPLTSGQANVSIGLTVPSACTQSWTAPLNVLGAVYHAHLLGKYLNVDVMRDNKYEGQLFIQNGYDFNHQSLTRPHVKQLKPGDQMSFKCTYDTSSRTAPVHFGDLTQTEMCWGAILYYPSQAFGEASYVDKQYAQGNPQFDKVKSDAVYCKGGTQPLQVFTSTQFAIPGCVQQGDLASSVASSIVDDFKTQLVLTGNSTSTSSSSTTSSSTSGVTSPTQSTSSSTSSIVSSVTSSTSTSNTVTSSSSTSGPASSASSSASTSTTVTSSPPSTSTTVTQAPTASITITSTGTSNAQAPIVLVGMSTVYMPDVDSLIASTAYTNAFKEGYAEALGIVASLFTKFKLAKVTRRLGEGFETPVRHLSAANLNVEYEADLSTSSDAAAISSSAKSLTASSITAKVGAKLAAANFPNAADIDVKTFSSTEKPQVGVIGGQGRIHTASSFTYTMCCVALALVSQY